MGAPAAYGQVHARRLDFMKFRFAVSTVLLALSAGAAFAQSWPTKPVRIINPFPPGGGTDAFARPLAETLYTKLPYSLERDFVPLTVVAYVPNVVVVNPKHTFKNVKELLDYAKANPGKLNYGSAGNGTTHHLAVELFKTMTGAQLTHVPYKGAGPLMPALLGGEVDLAFDGMGTSATQIKAGKLRPLAVTTKTRSPVITAVPTM